MPAISAADAISPAIQRTRGFLFRPFRLGTYLKLCLVAVLTEGSTGGGGNFNFNAGRWPHRQPSHVYTPFSHYPIFHGSLFHGPWLAMLVALALVGIVVGLIIAWLITRLRFAYFHCLITNSPWVSPGWHLYRDPATRFFWMTLAVGLCFLVFMVALILPFAAGIFGLARNAAGGHLDFGALFAFVLPLIPILMLIAIAAIALNIVLTDFMLPHYALENASAGEAWSAAWARIRVQKGQFFFYALLRVILPIVASIAVFIILIIPAVIGVLITVGMEVGIHAALGNSFAGITLEVLVGAVAVGVAILVGVALTGPINTAIREYALMFYGSRYERLGAILWPAPPASPPAPPSPLPAPGMG